MGNFPNRALKQTALYWANPVASGWGGSTFDDPIEITCRWVEKKELFVNQTGDEVNSLAVVHVDQDVDIGGYLMLGDLDDISSDSEPPGDLAQAYEIQGFSKVPNFKGTKFKRKLWL